MEKLAKSTWERVKFGDVARSLNASVRDPLAAGIERFVGLEHIEPNSLHLKSWGNVADGVTFTRTFKKGNILFGKRRAYQRKAAVADFDGLCSGDILVMEANEKRLLPALLPFLVHSDGFFDHAVKTSAGSLSPRTKFKDLAEYEFLLPPREQQAKLAELLQAADDIGDKYEAVKQQLINALESYRSDLFAATNVAGAAFDSVAVNSKFQEIPFKNLIKIKVLNGIYKSAEHLGRGTKIVNMRELFAFPKLRDPEMGLISLTEKEKAQFSLKKGDLLFARRSLVIEGAGKCAIVMDDEPKVFESSIIRARLDSEKINPLYCFHFLNSVEGKRRMRKIVGYTTVAGITGSDLLNFTIPVVIPELQNQVVTDIERFESEVERGEIMIGCARSVRASLVNRIFSS